ncbi:hypothetical protein ZIOFF_016863 [Zingiber officinale]|uniref:Uncharacterized protein n=1 Tax=Zingiber officinale TaxID=94328 RepID=A0A8J5LR48_ZINOF|nr:hypothetical protein ZIOFF_016863 [Zingiber officinale]
MQMQKLKNDMKEMRHGNVDKGRELMQMLERLTEQLDDIKSHVTKADTNVECHGEDILVQVALCEGRPGARVLLPCAKDPALSLVQPGRSDGPAAGSVACTAPACSDPADHWICRPQPGPAGEIWRPGLRSPMGCGLCTSRCAMGRCPCAARLRDSLRFFLQVPHVEDPNTLEEIFL